MKKMEGNPNAHAEPWGQGITRSPIASRAEPAPRQPGEAGAPSNVITNKGV